MALRYFHPPRTVKNEPEALPAERHLSNIKQLTFGGGNAEAYFSGRAEAYFSVHAGRPRVRSDLHDGRRWIQRTNGFDRNRSHNLLLLLSKSRPNHLFVDAPGRQRVSATSRFLQGYVWAIYPTYDIFIARPNGTELKQLTNSPGYDAEATISTYGKKIVFTSMRDGDLDIYSMDANGKNVRRLTTDLG